MRLSHILAVTALAVTVSLSVANAAGIAEKHVAKNLPCTVCHKTATGGQDVEFNQCLQCHNADQLKAAGEKIKPRFDGLNPHAPHFEDLSCMECHKGHAPQENFCAGCHATK